MVKSAPYPRLKNSKKTSKCQVLSFTVLENQKFYEKLFFEKITYSKNGPSGAPGPLARAPGALKGDTSEIVNIFVAVEGVLSQNNKKLKRGKFLFSEKHLRVPKKTEWGDHFGIFQHPFCRKTAKKLKGGTFGEKKFRKKSLAVPKKMEGGTLWSLRVWYGTRENWKNVFGSVRLTK